MGKESTVSVHWKGCGPKERSNFWGKVYMLLKTIMRGSNWRGKIVGGLVTFLTMCSVIALNPSILGDTGMPIGGVFLVTTTFSIITTTKFIRIIKRNRTAQQ